MKAFGKRRSEVTVKVGPKLRMDMMVLQSLHDQIIFARLVAYLGINGMPILARLSRSCAQSSRSCKIQWSIFSMGGRTWIEGREFSVGQQSSVVERYCTEKNEWVIWGYIALSLLPLDPLAVGKKPELGETESKCAKCPAGKGGCGSHASKPLSLEASCKKANTQC